MKGARKGVASRRSVAAPYLLVLLVLFGAPGSAQPQATPALPLNASTFAGFPVHKGYLQPNLGLDSDFLLAPQVAAKKCSDWAAINVSQVSQYYGNGGRIEIAPPDKPLACTIRRVNDALVNRDEKAKTTLIVDMGAILSDLRLRDEWRSDSLEGRVTQLTHGKTSFHGRLSDDEQRLAELKRLELIRARVHAQLVSLQLVMRSSQPWPTLAGVASALWPHQACLVEYKGGGSDANAAKKAFLERRGYFVATDPTRQAFAFYGEYLQLVDGVMDYKSPNSAWRSSWVATDYLFPTRCEPGVPAVALPFYAERRPAPPAPGRKTLEAYRDVDEVLQALVELGKWLEAESMDVGEARERDARLLELRAGELVQPTLDRIQQAKGKELALADALRAHLIQHQKLPQMVADTKSTRTAFEKAHRDHINAKNDEMALRDALTQARLVREKSSLELSQAAAARSSVALACRGASYSDCSDQAAKDEYDRTMYQSSEKLTQAMAAAAKADVQYQAQNSRLDALLDEQISLRDELTRLRDERDKAQLALDAQSQLPPWDAAKHKADSALAAEESISWTRRLTAVNDSVKFAKLVLSRTQTK